jgi:hypothetical protein
MEDVANVVVPVEEQPEEEALHKKVSKHALPQVALEQLRIHVTKSEAKISEGKCFTKMFQRAPG